VVVWPCGGCGLCGGWSRVAGEDPRGPPLSVGRRGQSPHPPLEGRAGVGWVLDWFTESTWLVHGVHLAGSRSPPGWFTESTWLVHGVHLAGWLGGVVIWGGVEQG